MSPVANSSCTRSSKARIVRIIRYASSSAFGSSPGVAGVGKVSVIVDVLSLSDQQPEPGRFGQGGGDVDTAGTVGTQPDRRVLAGAKFQFTLTVHGDDPARGELGR